MNTPAEIVETWIKRLRSAALPALKGTPIGTDPGNRSRARSCQASGEAWAFIDGFRDGAGHRRALDRPMLAHVLGCDAGPAPEGLNVEAMAWWGLHDPAARARLGVDMNAAGPLFPRLRDQGIETRTEAELSCLHALLWAALRGRDGALMKRCFAAARWLVAELQPDNATQRPWAVQAFVVMACDPSEGDAGRGAADVYAQTLLHNAAVGGLDVFSAVILWDSAEWLERSQWGVASGEWG